MRLFPGKITLPAMLMLAVSGCCLSLTNLVRAHDAAAPPAPGVQSLDVCRNGTRLVLLTGETASPEAAAELKVRTSDDGGRTWSDPVRVDRGCPPPAALHRGLDAQVAAFGEHMVAVWQYAGTDPWGGGPMATALSSDGGKTWKPGPNPADDHTTTGHNFIDIAADGKGLLHCVWLDTRQEKRGLRSALSKDFGRTWTANQPVDPETCECCWNSLAVSPAGGAWVIYRKNAPRDMSVAALGEKPSLSVVAGAFGWDFPGCPHVGAGLSLGSDNNTLHAAVWTGKSGKAGVYHLLSRDQGLTWLPPQAMGNPSARNPDCATGADSSVAMVWNETLDSLTTVMAATSRDGGRHWNPPLRLSSSAADASDAMYPRILPAGNGFRVFWTSPGEKSTRWDSAWLPLDPSP